MGAAGLQACGLGAAGVRIVTALFTTGTLIMRQISARISGRRTARIGMLRVSLPSWKLSPRRRSRRHAYALPTGIVIFPLPEVADVSLVAQPHQALGSPLPPSSIRTDTH